MSFLHVFAPLTFQVTAAVVRLESYSASWTAFIRLPRLAPNSKRLLFHLRAIKKRHLWNGKFQSSVGYSTSLNNSPGIFITTDYRARLCVTVCSFLLIVGSFHFEKTLFFTLDIFIKIFQKEKIEKDRHRLINDERSTLIKRRASIADPVLQSTVIPTQFRPCYEMHAWLKTVEKFKNYTLVSQVKTKLEE